MMREGSSRYRPGRDSSPGIDLGGQRRQDASFDGDEHPLSQDVIEQLIRGFSSQASELRAVAVCSDVTMSDGHDGGVRVEIEHRDHYPITCLLPYRQKPKKFTFDDVQAFRGEERVFSR